MTGATAAIADFITNVPARDFPRGAGDKAKKALADTFAVMLAGASAEVAPPLMRYLDTCGESGASPVLATGRSASAETAALVNGTFGHALDYDDVLTMMPGHPSVVILAAVLASLNGARVSGRALIDAYVIGIEAGGKLGLGITNEHYHRGFHATGTLGIFAAVAALARLHGMKPPAIRQALGIAASAASGLRRNFGTMTKPLHSGLAARSALTAYRLADAGFTAAPDAIEAPAGFFAAYGTDASDAEAAAAGLGKPFVIDDPGLSLKKFPCCYATHRPVDAMLTLRGKLGFDAAAVERVVCRMPPGGMQVLTYPRPATGLEGKFSLPYCLAAGALDGEYSLATFSDAAVRRREIADLYARIDAREDPACRGDAPDFERHSAGSRGFVEVEVKLRDGRSERMRVDRPPGAPGRELTWDELRTKFRDCALHSQRIAEGAANDAFDAFMNLDRLEDIAPVIDRLR